MTRGEQELHAVSMALGLARAAVEQGHRVTVFFNVASPVFVSSSLGEDVKVADFPPIIQMVREVIAGGGRVLVCGHCARLAGIDPATILPGVTIAQHTDVLAAMESGMVGISY